MRLFDTNVQQIKYKVLKEVANLVYDGNVIEGYTEIPKKIINGKDRALRCCIYKERAIVQERVDLVLNPKKRNKTNMVRVIDIACDECPVHRFTVSEACRGCIAHRCSENCPVNAIIFVNQKAVIDREKCIECGKCKKVCPYNAIIEQERPCINACGVGAISINGDKKARIDENKCINCGACVYQCPFGAISDVSYIKDTIEMLKASNNNTNYRVYAAIAPSIASQFSYAKIGQVVAGIKKLGFHDVVEVALGADYAAYQESHEIMEKGELFSSCCPSFVQYVEKFFPELKDKISKTESPMTLTSRIIKKTDPDAKVIFIGPCISKKSEFQRDWIKGVTDGVITFEELQALLDSREIHIEDLHDDVLDNASYYGRIFAATGGLTKALHHAVEQSDKDFAVNADICNGIKMCKTALLKKKAGRSQANFIEGMACEGGCINGAAALSHGPKNKSEVDKYGCQAMEKSINDSLRVVGFIK